MTVFTVNMYFPHIQFQFLFALKWKKCYFSYNPPPPYPSKGHKLHFMLPLKGLMVLNLWIFLPITILHLEQISSQDKYAIHIFFLDSL